MEKLHLHSFTSLQEKCSNESTNIFGRNICRIFGKRKCDNCEYRQMPGVFWPGVFWGVRHPQGDFVILPMKPIKSSLGYLWGYPTVVTHEEPKMLKIARQGTTSRGVPRKYRL